MEKNSTLTLAIAAIMIAVTAVFTLLIKVPIPGTQEFFNFCDVATYFAAYAFGPLIGFLAGGVGAFIADPISGYPQWMFISLFAHGLQGLVAGIIGRRRTLLSMLLGWAAGAVIMVTIYFFGASFILGQGWPVGLAGVPFNALQTVVGGVIGIPLVQAVRKAYPPIARMNETAAWREE